LAADAGFPVGHIKDLQEVRNYINALEYGLERLKTLPISLRLLREIHERLMQGVRGKHATPGQFRTTQNWIGKPGANLSTAKYVPPPPECLMECLDAFETFLHNKTLPVLVHLALCHYQFEAIHPFVDGNGRLGRLLMILLLVERKALAAPLLYLSAFFERTREEYYQHLFEVSASGTWEAWLLYFFKGVASEAADALSRAERINTVLTEWRLKVVELPSPVPAKIVDCLAENPFLSVPKVATRLGVAFTTVQRAVQKLEALGILRLMVSAKRTRIYCADALFEALKAPVDLTRFTALGIDLPRSE
jgi:Fic family protein